MSIEIFGHFGEWSDVVGGGGFDAGQTNQPQLTHATDEATTHRRMEVRPPRRRNGGQTSTEGKKMMLMRLASCLLHSFFGLEFGKQKRELLQPKSSAAMSLNNQPTLMNGSDARYAQSHCLGNSHGCPWETM